jgi:hypothetical protein
MPPKAVLQIPFQAIRLNNAPRGVVVTRRDHENVVATRPQVPTAGGNAGFPLINVVEKSDIFTYGYEAIVIATEVDMEHRNERPLTKHHLMAGPNLRRFNKNYHFKMVLDPITNTLVNTSDLTAVTSAVRSPGKFNSYIHSQPYAPYVKTPLKVAVQVYCFDAIKALL